MKKHIFLVLLILLANMQAEATRKRVLFLGNSYTAVNDLPAMVGFIAQSQGDTLVRDAYMPGGQTLRGHFQSAEARAKIALGNWDIVVIQAQSQEPSFPEQQVQVQTLPFARKLDSLVKAANPACVETVFYMTWGRKNGDASNCPFYPPLCTYAGMQGQLRNRYLTMARESGGLVCPAGVAWSRSIAQKPQLELYQTDQSHPSLAGTYLTALAFYNVLFEKKTKPGFYKPAGVADSTAAFLRTTAEAVVWDSARTWFGYSRRVKAGFAWEETGAGIRFRFTGYAADSLAWDFGNGATQEGDSVLHTFPGPGWHTVRLRAWNRCRSDVREDSVWVNPTAVQAPFPDKEIILYPNPGTDGFQIRGTQEPVEIRSLDGRKLCREDRPEGKIMGKDLPAGLYWVRVGKRWVRWAKGE